jgi:alginate O-acetyltransferase complex protein AlgI
MGWQPGRWSGLWRVLSFSLTFLCITLAWVLFRADNLDTAMNIYRGMAGLDGRFILPATYENLLSPVVSSLGLTFVRFDAVQYFEGMREAGHLAIVLFLVLALPNTQEWMSRWRACLEPIQIPHGTFTRMLLWRPSMIHLLVVVTILTVAVSQMFRPTEFLYFQF